MLDSNTRLRPPESIYNRIISIDQGGVIDHLYTLVLERTDPEDYAVMHEMLAIPLAAFEPLTVGHFDDIVNHNRVDGSAKALVDALSSVLSEVGFRSTLLA
ncbi:hypothetical protein PIIN_02091 [Serendipita indica DSM 11827]|uniref:Uncharacterized protein n=1 Tax=Serendipita indica (strain DSM 11827) TaxID=1109443 RepID=G4TA61_SERID|nr:hypothetical protein PIIN_02091 [Serendipita indica DSM 11827]